jgi:hypothetical protein
VAGLVTTLGRGAFLWRDWWRWEKGDQVKRRLAKLRDGWQSWEMGHLLKKSKMNDIFMRPQVAKVKRSLSFPSWPSSGLQSESSPVKIRSV